MKVARATAEDVDALLNLMRVLTTAQDSQGFPCKPDGSYDYGEDCEWFDVEDKEHLRKFYDRVMGCFEGHPGGLLRTIGGYHLAMTNDVFDPDAEFYEWHPSLKAAVEARERKTTTAATGTEVERPASTGFVPLAEVLPIIDALREMLVGRVNCTCNNANHNSNFHSHWCAKKIAHDLLAAWDSARAHNMQERNGE